MIHKSLARSLPRERPTRTEVPELHARPFPYEIGGACAELGTVIDMESWARQAGVPDRRRPGAHLTGATVTRLLAVESKAWDPDRFADLETVARVARGALDSARLSPAEVTAVVLVTCTPYQVMLDQDAFALLRILGIPDHVPPVQLGAGCAGLARAAAVVSSTDTERALVIAYNVASRVSTAPDGSLLPTTPTTPCTRTARASGRRRRSSLTAPAPWSCAAARTPTGWCSTRATASRSATSQGSAIP
ncbi:hypothetical protein QQY66_47400 [Streptomyces sp. DG2A-72]|uniref:hypothetical protein n=1 Tax=Streptomyces sp. DG2A-72 TaxID=3051386 RepID=UPI00265BF1D3|nr:hypothetical protein [Streptomyces sp. DG2A-72]MDO0938976.1 hypothetical protein [Streptomyces sp. DG2A-72]